MFGMFDIGGTNVRIAVSADGASFGEPIIAPTPQTFDEGSALLISSFNQLKGQEQLTRIIGGIAGPLDLTHSMTINAPNLAGWNNQPLKGKLVTAFDTDVRLENDTALVGLGEACYGAGKGAALVAYITVSTGINGVRIVNGTIDHNRWGFEIGHQIINVADRTELESIASAGALQRRLGQSPQEITDPTVWDGIYQALAVGIHNTLVYWSPDVVVIGGGMSNELDFARLDQEVNVISHIFPSRPPIKKATLDGLGGLYGGLALAKY